MAAPPGWCTTSSAARAPFGKVTVSTFTVTTRPRNFVSISVLLMRHILPERLLRIIRRMSAVSLHLETLNAQQRRAASFGEPLPEKGFRAGPLLIIAGAGTGKTSTLAHRVAHLAL